MSGKKNGFFEVDHKGLAKLVERRGKKFILHELIQNTWDQNVRRVNIILRQLEGRSVEIIVEDDDPDGFHDLSHAYTLFAESNKKADPTKRGRFNLGEKLVLAQCDAGEISTTKGTVVFDENGRHSKRQYRANGSLIRVVVKMTRHEFEECCESVKRLIQPDGIETICNGEPLPRRKPIATVEDTLPTEISDEDGNLRPSRRKTIIDIYKACDDEGHLYELGIPVVEIGMPYDVNIGQKVPLNMDRDNVLPSYAKLIKALVLNVTADKLTDDQAQDTWINDAIADEHCEVEAIAEVVTKRFGEQVAVYDPNDPESRSRVQASGYAVIYGRELPKGVCQRLREKGLLQTTSELAPTHSKLQTAPIIVPSREWTSGMQRIVRFAKEVAHAVMGINIEVSILNNPDCRTCADFGRAHLRFNLANLGRPFFEQGISGEVIKLVIHELAHHFEGNHLSDDYHNACCMIGSKLALLALNDPSLFVE